MTIENFNCTVIDKFTDGIFFKDYYLVLEISRSARSSDILQVDEAYFRRAIIGRQITIPMKQLPNGNWRPNYI